MQVLPILKKHLGQIRQTANLRQPQPEIRIFGGPAFRTITADCTNGIGADRRRWMTDDSTHGVKMMPIDFLVRLLSAEFRYRIAIAIDRKDPATNDYDLRMRIEKLQLSR